MELKQVSETSSETENHVVYLEIYLCDRSLCCISVLLPFWWGWGEKVRESEI